ncbi:hypothetical protein LCGC14_2525770 [marine sediment metagenome]|uniref:Uncharacterized protein n=1 Tax=marine sediment metagenome TaxID=412755 RepID=A0A0F9D6L0_9ZZZZ
MTDKKEAQIHNENLAPGALPMKDEGFEIISEKEKLWRDALVVAETNYLKSEASMLQNEVIILLCKEEVKKEADKNAR